MSRTKNRGFQQSFSPSYTIRRWRLGEYIRLSKEDLKKGKDDSNSVKNQRDLLNDFYQKHIEEFESVSEYVDDGHTGTDANRENFQRLLADVMSGKINCVVVKDLSRFARNYSDAGSLIDNLFVQMGVRFISLAENVDSYINPDSVSSIIVPITNVMNDQYCYQTSKKIRQVFDYKRRNGQYIGSFAPYGYIKDPKDKHQLIVDPEAAEIVKLIYNKTLQGETRRAIVYHLNDHGIPSPTTYRKNKGLPYSCSVSDNPMWGDRVLTNILTNPIYTGDLVQGRRRVKSYKVHEIEAVPEDEWVRVADVNAADWGTKGDGTGNWGYPPEPSRCSVSVQLVYEDSSTNPADTTADSLKSKTIVYGYWSGGRGLGTMIFNGEDNYQIIKVTAETGTMASSASSSNTVTVTNFNWANNEETVWEGAATDSVSIGNPARNPSYDAPYDNLAWNTGDYNHNSAILIRVYVKAIPKSGALTVNYFAKGSTEPFYHYGINVEEKTVFDTGFARVTDEAAPGGAKLINNTVKNYAGETQTIQSDLSKMTEIGAQYRYSNYTFTEAERSTDGKTVNLYYTFNWNKAFVVDFGLPVVIRPNDVNENLKNATLTAAEITQSTTYANISVDNDKNITYTLKQTIDGEDNFSVRYMGNITTDNGTRTDKVDYSIKVIPATSVYYEDSLATFNPGAGAAADAKWSIDKDNTAAKVETNQALSALGAQDIYGYDEAYKDSTKLSMGSAHKVTVSADMAKTWTPTSQWPTATFTFKGTGFDVISLTDNTSGAIFVDVYAGKGISGERVKSYIVDNYYGYRQEKDANGNITWVVDKDAKNALYQIPVMKINDLTYGEYTAVITVFYDGAFNQTTSNQYNFWLDAIRVYNPMGTGADANANYVKDSEGYPQYIKLRDSLAKDHTATAEAVFIDGGANANIQTYANYGPNNEVYLANGQAIAFTIPKNTNIASIQIGAKAPDGNAAEMDVNGTKKAIPSATEMYYEIAQSGGQFTITNNGSGILSLTNLKITFTTNPNTTVTLAALSDEDQENAVAQVRALFAAPAVEPFNPDRFDASWSRNVRKGETAKLTVKTSEDVEAITVNGETIDSFTERHERTGWGWWAKTVTFREFTYTDTATVTKDYTVCAVNGKGVSSDAITATLTVRPSVRDWLHGIFGKWF